MVVSGGSFLESCVYNPLRGTGTGTRVVARVCCVCAFLSSMTAAPLYYWWSLGAHIFRGLFQAQTKYANTHLLFFPFYRITNKQISSIRRWAFAAQRTIIYVCVARELLSFTQMWRRKNKRVVPAATQALRMCHCAQPAVRSRRPAYLQSYLIFFSFFFRCVYNGQMHARKSRCVAAVLV